MHCKSLWIKASAKCKCKGTVAEVIEIKAACVKAVSRNFYLRHNIILIHKCKLFHSLLLIQKIE